MAKREIDWLLFQTSGREYYTVVVNHLTRPKGLAKYPYPTEKGALAFAKTAFEETTVDSVKVLDTSGTLLLEYPLPTTKGKK